MQQMRKLIFLIIGFMMTVQSLMAIDEPKYEVIDRKGDIEIREYSSYIVAEMIVSSDFEEAGNEAFSTLVGYIGGENISQQSIEMTSPVSQEKIETTGQEIEMTAPVSQESMDSGKYRIAFVMPDRFTLESLPVPKDDQIQIREIPAKKMAVIRYSGTWSRENYQENESLLYEFLNEKGYEAKGNPVWARYDPPFMPWLFRRNEIMIEID